MAKRFTDTEKWRRPWFRNLQPAHKLLWFFMLDNCDMAGIWYVDFDLASFMTGTTIDAKEAAIVFEKQVDILENGTRWWIRDYIIYQYGDYAPKSKVHRGVLKVLKAHSLTWPNPYDTLSIGLDNPYDRLKDKDKAKAKDKDKAKDKEKDLIKGSEAPKEKSPLDVIIRAFKSLHGVDPDDAQWDKQHFREHVRGAKAILEDFRGDHKKAAAYVIAKGMEYRDKGLDWTLWAIHRSAGRDYMQIQGVLSDEQQRIEVGADRILDTKRNRTPTSAGALVSGTLAAIKRAQVEAAAEPKRVDGHGDDIISGEDVF